MNPVVIYEDNHLLVINKPAGWLVQGDKTGDTTLIDWGKAYLKEKYQKPGAVFLHPVHRIDRPVSGAVLFARTDKALERLTAQFRTKEVEKKYIAIVLKRPKMEEGRLLHWLLKDERKNIVTAYAGPRGDAKQSELVYKLLLVGKDSSVLSVFPITGRSHQIRVQLASMGCSIVGDLKYGAKEPLADASIGLHCRSMTFIHPVKKEPLTVTADFPKLAVWKIITGFR